MARRAHKQNSKNDTVPGPSDSVSTATPQLSGSTPRDGVTKDMDVDTPASSESRPSPDSGEDGNAQLLSPTEFLGTLDKEGLLDM